MKIEQTTLSMDAYSRHTEMTTEVSRGAAVSEWQTFVNEATLKNALTVTTERRQPPAVSAESVAAEPSPQAAADDSSAAIISRITNALVAEETSVADFKRDENTAALQRGGGFLLSVEHTRVRKCVDTIEFDSSGSVQTADGRSITFNMGLSVERSVATSCRWNDYEFLDPITLSFDDGLEALSGGTFSFDLTGDGRNERIASLAQGSGFLALDVNGDGVINNGLELFGPQSGNGYDELSRYDTDGNMWIDENDPIFDQLKIWKGAGSADARLISLREAGVGALSLASVAADFDMKDSSGRSLGQVSRAGLFLMENGEARSMQEIDLNSGLNRSDAITLQDGDELSPLQQAIVDAIDRLRAIIERHEQQGQQQLRDILFHEERSETLIEKFWGWQERGFDVS